MAVDCKRPKNYRKAWNGGTALNMKPIEDALAAGQVFCVMCATLNAPNATACEKCGRSLSPPDPMPETRRT